MTKQRKTRALIALAAAGLMALALAGPAQAKLTGAFKVFEQCPYNNAEAVRCLYSVTESGTFTMGSKEVPIEKPVTLQAGYGKPSGGFAKLVEASNGKTLSETPQKIPGGLAGFVNCKKISNFVLRILCEVTFENGFTGVSATLLLAKPPNEVFFSEIHFAEEEGVALKLPVKVRLENPLFGENCIVGSSSKPIMLELTTGTTAPPEPNKPITGSGGNFEFLEEGRVLKTTGNTLVDNAWAAPAASGCGGTFSFLLDPIVNASAGLPATAGHNTAILTGTSSLSTTFAVRENNEKNP